MEPIRLKSTGAALSCQQQRSIDVDRRFHEREHGSRLKEASQEIRKGAVEIPNFVSSLSRISLVIGKKPPFSVSLAGPIPHFRSGSSATVRMKAGDFRSSPKQAQSPTGAW
jgi:hypothetical protein